MAGLGTTASTLITTKGLWVNPTTNPPVVDALHDGAVITPWFRLYIGPYVPPVNLGSSNGGSRVFLPGEIQDLYQPVDPTTGLRTGKPQPAPFAPYNPATGKRVDNAVEQEPWLVVPREKEADFFGEGTKVVKIQMKFGDQTVEKNYQVRVNAAKRLIEVINFINASKARISVAVSGIKRVTTRALVEVRKLRIRK